MINIETASSVIGLTMVAESKKMMVVPVPGTPVADLVNITNNSVSITVAESNHPVGEQLTDHSSSLSIFTKGTDGVISTHSRAMDEYVNEISKAVTSHISYAKNVVKPAVLEMVENVQKSMTLTRAASAEFNINIVDLPLPMQNSGFEDAVSSYAEKTLFNPEFDLNLGEMSSEQMLALIQTGSTQQDADIGLWFAGLSSDLIACVWGNVFRNFKVSAPPAVKSIGELLLDKKTGVHAALLTYLAARKLFEEVPESTGLSLSDYKNRVAQIRDYAGVILFREYTRYNSSLKNGTLILSTDPSRKSVNVNGVVYREWLKTGGTNEVILGMLVSNQSLFGTNLINEQAEKFKQSWSTYEQYSVTAQRNDSFNTFKQALKLAFDAGMANMSAEEAALKEEKPEMFSQINLYFLDELALIRTGDMKDINATCLKLVCRSRYFYTSAEKILQSINDAMHSNPNMSVRDAAAIAAIEYVTDYVSDQLKMTM
jgi:hypothetical protein